MRSWPVPSTSPDTPKPRAAATPPRPTSSHRKLESWFLPPFERVAKEGCGTFMLGYESIEGVPVTFNHWLLSEKLRGEWNYQGTLITDWDNVGRSVWEQHVKPDYTHAAADAVKAGNDLVMTTPQFYEGAIEAVRTGMLDEALIDDAVSRILALKFRLGLFEDPRLPDAERIKAVIGSDEHQRLNLEVARESVALLKNNGALPFEPSAADGPKRIAVVGPLADDAQMQLGDWAGNSGQVDWMPDGHPREMIDTVLDGFKALVPEDWEVAYSRGANIVDLISDPEGETFPDGQPRPKVGVSAAFDQALLDEAVENARRSDLIVAVVGDVIQMIGETCSTATLELLGGQNALIDALAAVARETGKPFVVVLMSSKPMVLPASVIGTNGVVVDMAPAEGVSALLWAPSPGMKGGRAIAEIILGRTEPSGRLPITFPRHAGQLPVYYNQIRGQHGNRYADLTQDPAFAFGEGLSYTTFAYGEVVIDGADTPFTTDGTVHASVTLANTGDRPGVEVVQAYVGDLVTSYSWTDRELKAFRRVELQPGESATIEFDIPVADCTIRGSGCAPHRGTRRVRTADRSFEPPRGPQARHVHRGLSERDVDDDTTRPEQVRRAGVEGRRAVDRDRRRSGRGGPDCGRRDPDLALRDHTLRPSAHRAVARPRGRRCHRGHPLSAGRRV